MMMTWLLLAGLFGGMGSSSEAVLTFQEAWAEALRANPELRQAEHAARLAKLQFWEQTTRLFPWPSFTLEYTDKTYSTGGGGRLPPTLFRYGVSQRGYTEILSARVTLFSPTWVEGWIRQRAAALVAALQAEDRKAQIRLELVRAYARAL
ncbi:MAG: TolC family protein, partial [Candidatus Hydrothermae bacterium]|nr:TolC family protein [Candidatus Hydrothermae bacterium]